MDLPLTRYVRHVIEDGGLEVFHMNIAKVPEIFNGDGLTLTLPLTLTLTLALTLTPALTPTLIPTLTLAPTPNHQLTTNP